MFLNEVARRGPSDHPLFKPQSDAIDYIDSDTRTRDAKVVARLA